MGRVTQEQETGTPVYWLNVSEIEDYEMCPSYWAQKYVFKRVLADTRARALEIGKSLHTVWEQSLLFLKNTELTEERLQSVMDGEKWITALHTEHRRALGYQPPADELNTLKQLGYWAGEWWKEFNRVPKFLEILEIEKELCIELHGITPFHLVLFGKLDTIVSEEDLRCAHLQLKSWDARGLDVKIDQQRRCLHETLYKLMGEQYAQERGLIYTGTNLLALLKLSAEERGGRRRSVEEGTCYRRLDVDRIVVRKRIQDMADAAVNMYEEQKELLRNRERLMSVSPLPTKQVDACGGKYGTGRCQYIDVCDGKLTLDHERAFVDIDPTAHYTELWKPLDTVETLP